MNFPEISKKTYFIAEIGSNFDNDKSKALSLIALAKESGADAVKFQHYKARTLVSSFEFERLSNNSHQTNWKKSVFETYKAAELPVDWTEDLSIEAKKQDIDFITSPYAYDLADKVAPYVDAFKIGSGDITWLSFIEYVASFKKPLLVGTGASTLVQVKAVYNIIKPLDIPFSLMQCNTNYSKEFNNLAHINLNVLKTYAHEFPEALLGLSDHTQSLEVVLGAVALGGRVIERHFTDNNELIGPDHAFALNPTSFKNMVEATRTLELALGVNEKRLEKNEIESRVVQQRSICALDFIPKGSILTEQCLTYLRPFSSSSYSPDQVKELLGKQTLEDLQPNQSIKKEILK